MKTVQDVIDKLGTPPSEICLDWAWQLHNLDGRKPGSVTRDAASSACWSDFAVDDQGRLRLSAPPTDTSFTGGTTQAAIHQLLAWAESACESGTPHSGNAGSPHESTEHKLRRYTLAFQQSNGSATYRQPQPSAATLESATLENGQEETATIATEQTPQPAKATTAKRFVKRPQHGKAQKGWRGRHLAWLVLSVSILTAFGMLASRYRTSWMSENATQTETDDNLSKSKESNTSELIVQEFEISKATATDNPNSISNLDEISIGATEQSVPVGELPFVEALSSTWEDRAREYSGPKMENGPAALNTNELGSPIDPRPTGVTQIAEQSIDVLGELRQLTEDAEGMQSESLLDAPSSDSASAAKNKPVDSARPPLEMDVFPVTQYQRVAKSLRVRDPSWAIRLQVAEGLDVLPAEPLVMTGRDTMAWVVREKHETNSATPAACIFVRAQMASGRDASLRLRVVAGAEDMPLVAMPVDQQVLEGLQGNLRQRSAFMQNELDRLRAVSDADGIPSELRSAMASLRRNYEKQLKLAARLLQIVAEIQNLLERLKGHIEIHATLSETAVSPSTKLLQFGKTWEDLSDEGS